MFYSNQQMGLGMFRVDPVNVSFGTVEFTCTMWRVGVGVGVVAALVLNEVQRTCYVQRHK